jgi:hypothetical protein
MKDDAISQAKKQDEAQGMMVPGDPRNQGDRGRGVYLWSDSGDELRNHVSMLHRSGVLGVYRPVQ